MFAIGISVARSASCGRAMNWRSKAVGLRPLEQGVDVLYVSELLGHSSAAITQAVYQHSRPERVRDAVNTISRRSKVERESMGARWAHGGRQAPTLCRDSDTEPLVRSVGGGI